MSENIIELIQTNLGYQALHKIDPNTQAEKTDSNIPTHTLGQAAITAVVIGFYKVSGNKDNALFVNENHSPDWLQELFGGKKHEVISKVADYANASNNEAETEMVKVANATAEIIYKNTKGKDIDAYMKTQRSNILIYLPAELQMGEVLNDNTIDDRTQKMEGPISNLVHAIEQMFSGSTSSKGAIEESFAPIDKPKN